MKAKGKTTIADAITHGKHCSAIAEETHRTGPFASDRIAHVWHDDFGCPELCQSFMRVEPWEKLLYENPLPRLSREEEAHLFKKMNYLKYRADQILTSGRFEYLWQSQIVEIDRLYAEAKRIRDFIVTINHLFAYDFVDKCKSGMKAIKYDGITLRSDRRERASASDDVMHSEAMVILIDCTDKFNVSYGLRFSTYCYNCMKRRVGKQNETVLSNDNEQIDHRGNPSIDYKKASTAIEVVERLIERLPDERLKQIVRMHYGLDGTEGRTLAEVAEPFNISDERARILLKRALKKMREMAAEDLDTADHPLAH